ncbi:AAA family ATPase [uncultured Merdimonas sp.]|uniref:ATP-binding protein n=1 Tax=uncultured Merdimonas sp. TaxID=2023269 RepID=UPI00320A4D11
MKILEVLLVHFGKFQNKRIRLEDGINIIYGENESGKSTIHTFIRGMLFGMERKRGRGSAYDAYSIYEPWDGPGQYAGVLRFESGGKTFRIERSFDKANKKAGLVCEDDGEKLSLEDGDLDALLDGLTAAGYENTISLGQMKARPDQSLGEALKEYATSCYAAEDGSLKPEQAIRFLLEQKKEVEKEIRTELGRRQQEREAVEQEASYVWRELHRFLEEEEEIRDRLRDEELREEKREEEHRRLVDELRPPRWRIHPLEILVLLAVMVAAFFLLPGPINYLVVIVIFFASSVYVWNRIKVGKGKKDPSTELIEELLPEEERVSGEKLSWELERVLREKKEKEIQYENLKEQLAEMSVAGASDQALEKRSRALSLAVDRMNELSEDFRDRLSRQLNEEASAIICSITGGIYQKMRVEEGLRMVLVKDGKRIATEQVSCGTAEQICFALRMAAAKILQEEAQPVILDDAFGNYDDQRLKATLRWLFEEKRQVLIFTCQKREIRALQEMGIPCNVIEI